MWEERFHLKQRHQSVFNHLSLHYRKFVFKHSPLNTAVDPLAGLKFMQSNALKRNETQWRACDGPSLTSLRVFVKSILISLLSFSVFIPRYDPVPGSDMLRLKLALSVDTLYLRANWNKIDIQGQLLPTSSRCSGLWNLVWKHKTNVSFFLRCEVCDFPKRYWD